jgi:hypothetical protein
MKTFNSISALAELALAAPGVEPLVVYDAVGNLARNAPAAGEAEKLLLMQMSVAAESTARSIRNADKDQLEFSQLLKSGESAATQETK